MSFIAQNWYIWLGLAIFFGATSLLLFLRIAKKEDPQFGDIAPMMFVGSLGSMSVATLAIAVIINIIDYYKK